MRRYAWRRDARLADDVVAETFAVAWRRIGLPPLRAQEIQADVPGDPDQSWAGIIGRLLGVSAHVVGNLFLLAVRDPDPSVNRHLHLVAYDRAGKVVADACELCSGR